MSQDLPEGTSQIPNKVVKQLLQSVRRLQNGDISRIMNRMGLLYRYNFGVSIPQLTQLASKHKANQDTANLLFEQNIREAKILASFLCETQSMSINEALKFGDEIKNQELIEQFSRNVFSKVEFLDQLIHQWIQGDTWSKTLCFYSIGWKVKTESESNAAFINWTLENTSAAAEIDNLLLQQAIGFAIQSISAKSDENKAKMTALAEKMMESEKKSVRRIAEDYLWLNAI